MTREDHHRQDRGEVGVEEKGRAVETLQGGLIVGLAGTADQRLGAQIAVFMEKLTRKVSD